MKVKIRLQNQGCKNHPFWWIVVQPVNKNIKGRYLEKLGYWLPRQTKTVDRAIIINKHRMRYWLGVGAEPSYRVHKILEKFDFMPKYPVPLGSSSLYPKPEKEYTMQFFKKKGPNVNNEAFSVRQELQEQMIAVERKKRLQAEAMANLGETGAAVPQIEEIKTTDIESEEADIFLRKKNFEELLNRFEKHRAKTAFLHGNDLRYNIYMRKMNKLTRKDLGLDVEAYKDYINNLKKFANMNEDFEIYARDQLKVDHISFRELVELQAKDQFGKNLMGFDERARIELAATTIYNTLRKLKRKYKGFLTKQDHIILQEFVDNMRLYLNNFDVFALTRNMYENRNLEAKQRENQKKLDFAKVYDKFLPKANISKKEFESMKALYKFDEELFFKKEIVNSKSPHVLIVDIGKYQDEIPLEIKEILYRPQKVQKLVDSYWILAKLVEDLEREENIHNKDKVYTARYPPKGEDEIEWIDKILNKVGYLIEQDRAEYEQDVAEGKEYPALSTPESSGDTSMYYKGDFQEKVDAYNRLTEEEKAALPVKDEIDKMDINDLMKKAFNPETENLEAFWARHDINIAKAFLGKNGGYSLRKYKKILLREIKLKEKAAQDRKSHYEARIAAERALSEEGESETAAVEEKEVPAGEEETATPAVEAAQELSIEDSDLSDEEDNDWYNMDDENFQRIVEEVRSMENLETEEEYRAYFDEKIKKEWRNLKRKGGYTEIDIREEKDPYYKMLKRDMPVESRYSNYYDIEDEEVEKYNSNLDKNIGRYPIGFRHYENYENYKIRFPNATLDDYADDMNRQVEFHEFKAIMKRAFLDMAAQPFYRFKNKLPMNMNYDPSRVTTPEAWVQTADFEDNIRKEYNLKTQAYLLDRKWYTLVDCLEDVSDYWTYGRDFATMPTYNVYVPTKEHLLPKPNLTEDNDDESGYRFNMNRLSAYQYLNPIKNYKSPPAPGVSTRYDFTRPKFGIKNRRLSRPKGMGFSTLVRPTNPIWYQTQVNSDMLNMFNTSYFRPRN